MQTPTKTANLEETLGHFQIYQVQNKKMYDSHTGYRLIGVILDGPLAGKSFDFDLDPAELEKYNLT